VRIDVLQKLGELAGFEGAQRLEREPFATLTPGPASLHHAEYERVSQ